MAVGGLELRSGSYPTTRPPSWPKMLSYRYPLWHCNSHTPWNMPLLVHHQAGMKAGFCVLKQDFEDFEDPVVEVSVT